MGKWGNFPQSPKPPLCCVGDFGIQVTTFANIKIKV